MIAGKQTTSMNLYTRCVCMFLLLAPYILARDIDCHEQCKCSSKHHEAVCSGRDLIYIPLFPENIHVVTMNGTNLTYIDINGFDNLTIIGLKKLQLMDNLISYIYPNLFKNLKFLSTLLISNEDKLNVHVLKRALGYSAKQKTQHLIFEFNKWSFLPIDLFSNFSSNEVTSLRIKGNAFSSIACETFFVMKSLYFLVLSNNLIEVINMTGIPNTVASLHLNNNMLSSVPDMCANGKEKQSLLRHLSILDLSDNSIGRMQEDSLSCLPALTKVLLNGNPLGRIHSNILINNPMLYVVQLSKIGYPLKHIDDFALNSSSMSSLRMQETNFHFDQEKFNPKTIFSVSPNLSFLYLDHSYLPKSEIIMQHMFLPLIKLKVLSLSFCSLFFLPKDTFIHLTSLETLSLSGNRFSSWNDGNSIFRNMISLRKLYLSNNFIRIINSTSFPLDVLNSLEDLDLSVNPYACTCDQLWFTKWIKATQVKLIGYPFIIGVGSLPNLIMWCFKNMLNLKCNVHRGIRYIAWQ